VWGHGFSEAVTQNSFLGPDSGVTVLKTVTRKSFLGPDSGNSNILLFLLSCTNKLNVRDMQDRETSDVCVRESVMRQLFRLPRSCMRVAKGTRLV
jgi:hypothetical protein